MRLTRFFLRLSSLGLVAVLAIVTAPARAGVAAPARAGEKLDLPISIQKATLDNGLRVVMNVDHSSPNVAICVTYDVGSRNEVSGRSGFAHLFEHMMFQGSRNVAKGQHFTLITARGGSLNGTTSSDRTNYYEILPAGELALGLWLEADRMKALAVTPSNFKNQRAVVQEEYRMRVSNQAYALGYMRLNELVFEGYFPYGHDAIGSMEDLDRAEFSWVKSFHDNYYAPNNAVLTIAGDFDTDRAMALVREYFGPAKTAVVPPYEPPELPSQKAERVAEMTDRNAKTPGLFYGWATVPYRHRDHYALELAAVILGDGESSRLYRRLVREAAVARRADAWTNDHRGPDLFGLRVLLTERAKIDAVERMVSEQIADLSERGPTEQEMEKAKNRVSSYFVFGIQSNLDRAIRLGNFELFYGDARLLKREVGRYLTVTGDDVKNAVRRYLSPEHASLVRVLPPDHPRGQSADPTPETSEDE